MQAVGRYLRKLRADRRLTQEEAASLVGLTAKTIERWEAGKHEPRLTELSAYVHAIGGSVTAAVRLLVDLPEDSLGALDAVTPSELAALEKLSPKKRRFILDLIDQFSSDL